MHFAALLLLRAEFWLFCVCLRWHHASTCTSSSSGALSHTLLAFYTRHRLAMHVAVCSGLSSWCCQSRTCCSSWWASRSRCFTCCSLPVPYQTTPVHTAASDIMHIRFVLNDFSLPLHGLRFRWYFRQLYDDLQEFVVNYRTPPLAAKLDASVSWVSVIGAMLLVHMLFIQYVSLQPFVVIISVLAPFFQFVGCFGFGSALMMNVSEVSQFWLTFLQPCTQL